MRAVHENFLPDGVDGRISGGTFNDPATSVGCLSLLSVQILLREFPREKYKVLVVVRTRDCIAAAGDNPKVQVVRCPSADIPDYADHAEIRTPTMGRGERGRFCDRLIARALRFARSDDADILFAEIAEACAKADAG